MTILSRARKALLVLLDAEDRGTAEVREIDTSYTLSKIKAGPTPHAVSGKCGSCKHFDHEAGQAGLNANPSMVAAAAQIPPWQMGRKVERDDRGTPIPTGVPKELLKLKWSDLGACELKQEGVFPIDTCGRYEARAT